MHGLRAACSHLDPLQVLAHGSHDSLLLGCRARGGLVIASHSHRNSKVSVQELLADQALLLATFTGKKDHNYKNRGRWTYPGGFQQRWCLAEFE